MIIDIGSSTNFFTNIFLNYNAKRKNDFHSVAIVTVLPNLQQQCERFDLNKYRYQNPPSRAHGTVNLITEITDFFFFLPLSKLVLN